MGNGLRRFIKKGIAKISKSSPAQRNVEDPEVNVKDLIKYIYNAQHDSAQVDLSISAGQWLDPIMKLKPD